MELVSSSSGKKRIIRLVRKVREGKTEQASNMITSSLGNTINGPGKVGGLKPQDFKKQMDIATDMMQQQNSSNLATTTTSQQTDTGDTSAPPLVDPNSDLGRALNGQQSNLDLSKVPDEQKNLLLQTMLAGNLNGQTY